VFSPIKVNVRTDDSFVTEPMPPALLHQGSVNANANSLASQLFLDLSSLAASIFISRLAAEILAMLACHSNWRLSDSDQ